MMAVDGQTRLKCKVHVEEFMRTGGEAFMSLDIGCGTFRRALIAGATGSAQNHPILRIENVQESV